MKRSLIVLLAAAMALVSCQHSLTSYVNPFIGTDGHGHTFPGAILPFGMVQASPDTRLDGWDGCSGYHYSDDTVYGFSHTHLSGTGCSDYGDLLLMPFAEDLEGIPDSLSYSDYLSTFSHRNEQAHPGYYSVVLDRNRVMVELTVHQRCALHHYTFPHAGRKGVVIDLKHRDVVISSELSATDTTFSDQKTTLLTGSRISAAWNPEQHFYFALLADCPVEEVVFYKDGKRVSGGESISGDDCKALVFFPENEKEVTLTVAISAVDKDGALGNLGQSAGTPFKQARKEADAAWEKALAQFEVEGGDKESRTNFYTALYHCMTSPYLYSDSDGRYRTVHHRDTSDMHIDTVLPGTSQYTVFSLWDTYRALHPLLNITDPQRSADFVRSFLSHWRNGGELTMWELASHETHCMIGYHAAPVIFDAYRTGVLDGMSEEELNELLEAMVGTAQLPMLGRTEYARDGFLGSEYENESVSKTLEYSYDDWCIAMMAKALSERQQPLANDQQPTANSQQPTANSQQPTANSQQPTYETFLRRSQSWKNLMDGNGFMHPRRNGAFVTPFDPTEVNNHFTEANSWQYSTYVPHDINGWVEMIGGEAKAETFLDGLFNGSSKMTGRDQSDITGLIGQYAHGNEPSHHAAYLYAFIGKQWKTAKLVRQICDELYYNAPDGLCGNEDCGQMSAWYVFSAMGLYPVCPGSGTYIIGSPLFKKVTVHLPNGKDLVINANGQGKGKCYIQSLKLNGVSHDKSFVTIEQIKDGCTLDFEMGDTPNEQWAADKGSRPLSQLPTDASQQPIAPVFGDWQQSFDGTATVTISSKDSIFYTLDGSQPTRNSIPYTGHFTVTGDAVINAVAYNGQYSNVVTHRLTHMVHDRSLSYITKPAPQYYENGEAGLIDRLHGTENYRIGGWQGWEGDCRVVIDLLEPRTVSRVGTECLENMRSWIFFPSRVVVEVSDDGSNFRPFGTVENTDFPTTLERQELSTVHNFVVSGAPVVARYVRINAYNYGLLPKWHVSAGNQAWLFIDEITVE